MSVKFRQFHLSVISLVCFIMALVLPAEHVLAGEHYPHPDEVLNVLLIGSDTRQPGSYGNSDAMVMMTINDAAKKIFLVSFMRDLYADIPDHGVQKLNAAHAIGGGKLLMETIDSNYHVSADNYIEVEFSTMAMLIDLLGGVTLELNESEVDVANAYIEVMCQEQGLDYDENCITGEGEMDLTGIQAVGYARNRVIGDDYERTSRQRKVLGKMLEKVRQLNPVQIMDIAMKILPRLDTDLDLLDLIGVLGRIPDAVGYEVVTDRVPYDDLYSVENEILHPDMEETIQILQSRIYEGCF